MEQQSFLFSNPTFESYLDSPSDDELAPVEGCTTPRSAIKQQASWFPLPFYGDALHLFPATFCIRVCPCIQSCPMLDE